VIKLTGFRRSTLWRLQRRGKFPRSRRIGDVSVGWLDAEVLAWVNSRFKDEGKSRMGEGITSKIIMEARMSNGILECDPTLAKGRTSPGGGHVPIQDFPFAHVAIGRPHPQPTTCWCSS
jgi:predicted DNA-binding transcriptional regulator AlpA